MEAYKIISMKESKTHLDDRVIQFLDEDLKELFDNIVLEETKNQQESHYNYNLY